jgi:hypothetical protein
LLDQKVTKNQVSRKTSLPHGPLPCKSIKTTAAKCCPTSFAPVPGLQQLLLCPFQRTWSLFDFVRSCSADERVLFQGIITIKISKIKAGKGLTEKRSEEFCLRVEAFFCLDLLVTFVSRQK